MKLVSRKIGVKLFDTILSKEITPELYFDFCENKSLLTDSQNRILNSRPMSMDEFRILFSSIKQKNQQ